MKIHSSVFCVILLSKQQTNKQTNGQEWKLDLEATPNLLWRILSTYYLHRGGYVVNYCLLVSLSHTKTTEVISLELCVGLENDVRKNPHTDTNVKWISRVKFNLSGSPCKATAQFPSPQEANVSPPRSHRLEVNRRKKLGLMLSPMGDRALKTFGSR